jgi:hypothetical protein
MLSASWLVGLAHAPFGLADSVAVLGPPLQGPEDKHVESPLEELEVLFGQPGFQGLLRCATRQLPINSIHV